MHLILDFDDVVVEFLEGFLNWINKRTGSNFRKEDSVNFMLGELLEISDQEVIGLIKEFCKSEEHDQIKMCPDVQRILTDMFKAGLYSKISIVSARPESVRSETERLLGLHRLTTDGIDLIPEVYLANHYGDPGKITDCKSEICQKIGGQIIIDDGAHNAENVANVGIPAIILTKPWNIYFDETQHDLIWRCSDWHAVPDTVRQIMSK